MKKLLLGISLIILVILGGCASKEDYLFDDEPQIYGYLDYDWNTMSFNKISERDILFSSYTYMPYLDFILLNDTYGNILTSDEMLSYQALFIVLENASQVSGLNYGDILSLSSSHLKELCDVYSVTVTLKDIVSFNDLNGLITELKSIETNYVVSKIQYIENRLDLILTDEEILSLDLLQAKYNDLYQITEDPFYFNDSPLEDFLVLVKEYTNYEPTETELTQLEVAYDILNQLIIE